MRRLLRLLVLAACLASLAEAGPQAARNRGKAGHRLDPAEVELNTRRANCDAKIRAEGGECTASQINTENCVLRCMSEGCYKQFYGSDPLEEGEIDHTRGRSFRVCARSEIRRQQLIKEHAATDI